MVAKRITDLNDLGGSFPTDAKIAVDSLTNNGTGSLFVTELMTKILKAEIGQLVIVTKGLLTTDRGADVMQIGHFECLLMNGQAFDPIAYPDLANVNFTSPLEDYTHFAYLRMQNEQTNGIVGSQIESSTEQADPTTIPFEFVTGHSGYQLFWDGDNNSSVVTEDRTPTPSLGIFLSNESSIFARYIVKMVDPNTGESPIIDPDKGRATSAESRGRTTHVAYYVKAKVNIQL